MARERDAETLLSQYFDALRGGALDQGAAIEKLKAILAEDYVDHNPMRGQLPGRGGVLLKAVLFRADHPDARIVVEEIVPIEAGARAIWTTTARGLNGAQGDATWRFTAVFEIDERIRSSDVISMELLPP